MRLRSLAPGLEWLTGWTPYWCQGCARGGWYRSLTTPPAFDELQRLFRLAMVRLSSVQLADRIRAIRMPSAVPSARLMTTAGALVAAFVIGFGMGALMLSVPAAGTDGAGVSAGRAAPGPAAASARGKSPVEAAPPRETRQAAALPPRETLPAAVPPPAPMPAPPRDDDRLRGAASSTTGRVTAGAPVVRQAATSPITQVSAVASPTNKATRTPPRVTAPAPATRTAARNQRQPQRRPSPPKQVVRTKAVAAPPAPALPRFHGSLAIHSEPRGALVSVDGQVVGATPILLKGVRAGSRVVRIESEGYQRWSSAARVVADKETAITATLQHRPPGR